MTDTNPPRRCPCGRARIPGKPACPRCWQAYLADNEGPLQRELAGYRAVAKATEPRPLSPHAKKWRFPQGWGGS